MAEHRAATSIWRRPLPRWLLNAAFYAALGWGSIGLIQSLGPFNEVQTFDLKNPENVDKYFGKGITVIVGPISDRHAKVAVDLTLFPLPNSGERANLSIYITSDVQDGFTFSDMELSANSLRSSDISPLSCEGHGEAPSLPASSPPTTSTAAPQRPLTFGVKANPLVGNEKPLAATTVNGSEKYSSVSIYCDATELAKAQGTASEVTYTLPPTFVLGAPTSDTDAADIQFEIERSPFDAIVTNSRPPDATTLSDYKWKTDPYAIEPLIVSVTDPDLRNARERSVFLWGLFAGVAAAFFVAAIQEVVNRAGRRSHQSPRGKPEPDVGG
ncbi:hypothetical protein QF031_000950 [Pseudarthrobacter defluvii]|uniref:hypothetical protein n=1 Tax=Pseudarthrobacter defluvii TaxID=410837 RepID=UPI0027864535|nr:hypothetical protein [Pseudarthrobacter defluvii]MDQ0768201.1 hypothetical protein [Pseudarthrobacter defluvii]